MLTASSASDYHDLKIPSPAPSFGRVAVFLALLNINAGNIISFGDPTARIASCFLGLVLIASLLKADWRHEKKTDRSLSAGAMRTGSARLCFLLPYAGLMSILLFLGSKELGVIGLICALGCLSAISTRERNQRQVNNQGQINKRQISQGQARVFITATGLFALFDYGYFHTAVVWYAVRWINQSLMSLFSAITARLMPFGHHASGLLILMPFVCYFFALVFHRGIGKRKYTEILSDFLIFFLLTLVSLACYLFVQQVILSRIQFNIYQASFLLTPFETHWLAFLLFLIPMHLMHRKIQKPSRTLKVKNETGRPGSLCLPGFAAFLIFAVAFISMAALAVLNIHEWRTLRLSQACGKRVLIYDNLDWSVPEFGHYGERSGGMFGNLPGFLRSLGYAVSTGKEISREKLQGIDLLVIINLMEKFDKSTGNAIHDYIRAGGNLLIMGDHTGFGFIREPFNDLLKPVPISFQFDSACSIVPSWQDCMEIRPHPITVRAANENDVQIGTGASLAVACPARPILVGKRAFSDPGDETNSSDGFLGDLQYQKSEWLGDVVLAAEAEFGQGKILVFGDTSSLQNGALPYDRQFIQDMFQWLTQASREGKDTHLLRRILRPLLWSLFLLALAVAWCRHPVAATLWLVIGLYLFQAPVRFFPLPEPDYLHIEGKANIALIDSSHGEFFDLTGWQKNSLDGLAYNLMRNQYAPFIAKELDFRLLDKAGTLFFVNPARSFSQEEKERLHRFMSQGGIIFLTAGWTVKESAASFLQDFGLSLVNIPLGPVKERYGDRDGDGRDKATLSDPAPAPGYEVQFQDAWPIRIEKQFRSQTTVILQKDDYPLVVFQKIGRGGILFISDSRFLLNQNLENINNFYHEGNIFFLRDIIKKISTPGYHGENIVKVIR